jgi:tetratricopeptide (TPR) repeat protein
MLESRGHFEDTPTPMYSIPQARRASGLYDEAMEAYEAILQEFPEERRAYVEMIDICIVNLKDPEWAMRVYQRGMEALKSEPDKNALETMYGAILTRLHEEMTEADRHKPVLKMPEHTGIIEEKPAKKVVRQLGGNRVQGSGFGEKSDQ